METGIPLRTRKEIMETSKEGEVETLKLIVGYIKDHMLDYNASAISWIIIRDKKGRSPLHLAAKHGHLNVIQFIYQEIINMTKHVFARKKFIDSIDDKKRTPLFYAAVGGHSKVVCFLIKREASLESCTSGNGSTALMVSAQKNKVKCFEILLEARADLSSRRKDGADALYMAARYGNNEIIKFLAKNDFLDSLINRPSFHGRTAFCTAALNGHIETCKILYKNGADLNYKDKDKFTPLILAASEGHMTLSRWLVSNGADIGWKNKHGASALDTALASGYGEIVIFLMEAEKIMQLGGDINDLARLCQIS